MTHHVLIVEDLPETARWLADAAMAVWPRAICHTVASLHAARHWRQAPPAPWSLALVDLALPDGSGVHFITELTRHHPDVTSVVTTIFDDDAHLFDALAAGAQGYLLKDTERSTLEQHLKAIEAGTPPISPAIARRLLAHFRERAPISPHLADHEPHLTPRELDVLRYIGRGLRVMETARLLNLTEHTVAGYVKSLYRKLNVSSRAEAALEAARRGLV